MTNLIEQAVACDDGYRAAKIIQDALGIESDDVVNYTFPKQRPPSVNSALAFIGDWLQTDALILPDYVKKG